MKTSPNGSGILYVAAGLSKERISGLLAIAAERPGKLGVFAFSREMSAEDRERQKQEMRRLTFSRMIDGEEEFQRLAARNEWFRKKYASLADVPESMKIVDGCTYVAAAEGYRIGRTMKGRIEEQIYGKGE